MKYMSIGNMLFAALLCACSENGLDSYEYRKIETVNETPKTYYLDATAGSDENEGTSPEKAWKTLDKASTFKYQPGDALFLKRGETFEGVLDITAEGTKKQPVVIDAYGEEEKEKPLVKGRQMDLYAARIYNSSYVTMQHIAIENKGEYLSSRSGLKIECKDYGTSRGLVIRELTVQNVTGAYTMEHAPKDKYSGAIMLSNTGKEKKTKFEKLLIENCHIVNCTRNGIFWSGSGSAYCNRANWYPNSDIIIRGNLLEKVPGDGILPMGCDGVLVEYNVMRECPWLGKKWRAAAGFWPWSSDNVTIQYNFVDGHQAMTDGQAFDCDYNCRNTVIQYNYSTNNHGGFVLFCDDPSATHINNIGVLESKVRYNISINDGIRPEKQEKDPSALIHFSGGAVNPQIDHNIIHTSPTKVKDDYDFSLVTASNGRALVKNPVFRSNVFYAPYQTKPHKFVMNGADALFENNWYLGNCTDIPEDAGARKASDYYQEQVVGVDAEGYEGLYKLMEKKTVCGKEFYFVKREAVEAFFAEMEKE